VRDQGVGIPPEELPHICTRFFRVSTAAGLPGTGIGLAGSKTIIEQHGGTLLLESAVGAGTTMSFPAMQRPSQPAELTPAYVFLASQDSSYITAETIGATGGTPLP
jgi:signal transduction histidine kinase